MRAPRTIATRQLVSSSAAAVVSVVAGIQNQLFPMIVAKISTPIRPNSSLPSHNTAQNNPTKTPARASWVACRQDTSK